MDSYREKPQVPRNYIRANENIVIFLDSILRLEYDPVDCKTIYHLSDGSHHKFAYQTENDVWKNIQTILDMKRAWELYKARGIVEKF